MAYYIAASIAYSIFIHRFIHIIHSTHNQKWNEYPRFLQFPKALNIWVPNDLSTNISGYVDNICPQPLLCCKKRARYLHSETADP